MNEKSYQSLRETADMSNQDAYFKSMFDCCRNAVFAFDKAGRCTRVNAAGGRLTGQAPDEWKGRSYKHLCVKEDRGKLETLFEQALLGNAGDCTIAIANTGGAMFTVDLSVNCLEMDGELQGIFFMARLLGVMTEREIHYAAAQKIAHLGSWEMDVSSDSLYWSDEMYRIFALQRGDVEQTYEAFLKHVHPDDVQLVRAATKKALSGGSCAAEYRILWSDGTVRIVIAEGEALFDEEGQPVKLLGVIQDITERRREQERLREIELRYQLIADNAQDILFYYTSDHVLRFVSPAVRHLLGYEPEEMIGKPVSDFVHPDDVGHLVYRQDVDKTVTTYRFRHRDGHCIWFETTMKFIRNVDGTPCKTLGVGRDITERIRANEELRAAQEELSNILRQQLGMTFKFRKVRDDFVYTMAEGQLLRLLDLTPEKVVGWTIDDLFPQDSHEYLYRYYERAWSGENVMYEFSSNGYIYLVSLQPLYRDGQVVEVLASGMDITSHKQAAEQLRATKEQLEAFIQYNVDAIVMFDREGRLQRCNPAFQQMFGWTEEELRGMDAYQMPTVPARYHDAVGAMLDEVRQGKPKVVVETQRLTKSGAEIDVLLTMSPTRDVEGNVSGWSVIMRDISEQRKAEQLLLQSEKLSIVGQLAAGIAHEIRNPLTALKGFTQLLKANAGRQEHYLTIMESELSRIELILSELLMLAKPQSERYILADLGRILEEVRALIESQATLHSIGVQVEVEPELPMIECDQNQLKQVFINFLKNAIEAMKDGGVIQVQVRKDGEGHVLVRFVDQGCGISKERLARIGEPFYTTKEKGTGLGMTVSKRIIENHRGQMHVESEVGVGTKIEVQFPCGEGEV